MALDIGIVGAGVAGLATGIAFRHAGHNVTIYERSQLQNEIGAAIALTSNGNLILNRWGFDAGAAGATDIVQARRLDGTTLESLSWQQWAGVEKSYGHGVKAFHRLDLHGGLRHLAEVGGVNIALAKEATKLDCRLGVIRFEDGTEERKDLVVVADGIKASLLRDVIGYEIPRKSVGTVVYRALIPMSKIRSDPDAGPIFNDNNKQLGFINSTPNSHGTMCITYPCRGGNILNLAIFYRSKEDNATSKDDWNSPATVQDAVDVLTGMHPAWAALTKCADHMKVFRLYTREPAPTMTCGKAVVIGDAAHPMMPTHAQGGCMALEDAAAFEVLFGPSHFQPGDSVEDRLHLYDQLRLPRGSVAAIVSNAMFYRQGSGTTLEIEASKFFAGKIPVNAEAWTDEIRNFFYGYDVFKEAEKAAKSQNHMSDNPQQAVQHFWNRAEIPA